MVRVPTPHEFTHVGPGTSARDWRAHPGWAAGEPLDLRGVHHLVVVAAHPDDESLGAGGLVAAARDAGVCVHLVCATDGEGSHPDSPSTTPQQLAAVRAHEARAAALELGVGEAQLVRLQLPDGDLADHQEQLTRRLVELVVAGGAGERTVLAAPWREDGHPDHEAAGRAAAAAARRTDATLWEYPVWFWHWGTPAQAPWSRLRPLTLTGPEAQAKQRAIASHRSQVAPLSDEPGDGTLLGPELLEHFAGTVEHLLVTPSTECPDDALDSVHEQDADPWGVESRWYEKRKRDLVLAALPRARFRRTLEVGCSTGSLAQSLATRTSTLVAVDRSPAALRAARTRLADAPGTDVLGLDVPARWPGGRFDLVVVSEVGYFLSPLALDRLVDRAADSLDPDGVVVLCHWRHPVEGWPLDGPAVHARVAARLDLPLQATYADRDVEIRVHSADASWPDPGR
ncbi:LmbE family N-acetylglucosaminyl deacetylase [Nocardioides aurantiacus]|uniref:LmbE family N-acetylglucosaminyl deacetylase n=1 Tax=Nocardioides aurantiacus TaxID=86796 RepID=A0A3N2CTR3_9ACTN|nr:LmbE family N-acetylglucosaminyl deacetylase [Nocardioides aurantiacus]